jgi:hypothetical protein
MTMVALSEVDNAAKSAPQRPTSTRTSVCHRQQDHSITYIQLFHHVQLSSHLVSGATGKHMTVKSEIYGKIQYSRTSRHPRTSLLESGCNLSFFELHGTNVHTLLDTRYMRHRFFSTARLSLDAERLPVGQLWIKHSAADEDRTACPA